MISMEKLNFLPEKYPDLPGSKPVERAVQRKIREGKPGPTSREERTDAYLERLEHVTEDERGYELLKNKILNRFTINTRDEETLARLAEGLYESEKRLAVEQGRGGDIAKLGSRDEIIEKYKPLIKEKEDIQRKTLSAWLNELQENDAKLPMSFRYFVVRSLEKMGTLDKEKGTYSKRAPTTVAAFPELNHEALGWVYKRLTEGPDPEDQLPPEKQKLLEQLIKAKDFAKLYAFAQIETAGKLNRESIEGEWRKYNKDGNWQKLERDLKDKGTGWCTAVGSAKAHLEAGNFYVYYSKGANGAYTEPRVAIRMEGDHVAEVRGVNQRQELEPELVDIAQAQYHNLPGGQSYDKKAQDMREVTRLMKKQEKGESFTKDDLVFLYEINTSIEGFGYEKDPRVAELRKQRNPKEDAPVVFECEPSQIAWKPEDITADTKAYVGKLAPGIFNKLANIDHIYSAFPEGKIRKEALLIGGKNSQELQKTLEQSGYRISDYARDMLNSKDFETLKTPEAIDLVRLTVKDLGFDQGATTDQIYARADELGLDLCPAEVGPQYRLSYKDQPMNEWFYVAMKQIADRYGNPLVFYVVLNDVGLWLHNVWASPTDKWYPGLTFMFRLRKSES
jgi:hypothetical protein